MEIARKLRVVNPLPGAGEYMGRHRALRNQKQRRLAISPCGQYATWLDTPALEAKRIALEVERLNSARGYHHASNTGVIPVHWLEHLPLGRGPKAHLRLITIPNKRSR